MLGWAIVFAVLAVAAGYLGFMSLAGLAATIAKVLFVLFLVLLVASFVVRAIRGQSVVCAAAKVGARKEGRNACSGPLLVSGLQFGAFCGGWVVGPSAPSASGMRGAGAS